MADDSFEKFVESQLTGNAEIADAPSLAAFKQATKFYAQEIDDGFLIGLKGTEIPLTNDEIALVIKMLQVALDEISRRGN